MPQNLLAITIGNTRTKLGAFVDDKLVESWAVVNTELREALAEPLTKAKALLRDADDAVAVLASVNPTLTDVVLKQVAAITGLRVLRIERDVPIAIGRHLDREAIVGEDRLLNAAAAYDRLKQACIVVDAGTAMTIDLIDGQGTFHGGAIAPGAQTMLDAVHGRTAQLPEVSFAKPLEPVGHNTVEAMRSAVYYGMRGMVRELTEQYAEVTGGFPMVVATGGDAPVLFEGFDLIERLVPDLTLLGIAVSLRRWHEAGEEGE